MDSTRQALQTNDFFFTFEKRFEFSTFFLKILVALWSCMRGGEGICAEQHAF